MRLLLTSQLAIRLGLALGGTTFAALAAGQGADVMKPSAGGNAAADEGLESATPTDSLNELGNGSSDAGGNDYPISQGPEEEDSGNDLFNDGPTQNAPANTPAAPVNNGTVPSAFGGAGPDPAAKAPKAGKTGPVPTVNATVTNPAPAVPAPTNTPPANAENLMNQIAPGNPAAAPAAIPAATETTPATGTEPLTAAPVAPAITAPPLPPPNEFAGAPPVPGSMRLMADGEAPEEYRVQPGDTLFDICDQLLDEAAYWPKLWALNPEIKNPHFIFPNMRLKFYPGDDDTPPYLQVVTEEDVIPIDKGDLDEQSLVAEKVNFVLDAVDPQGEEPPIEVIGPEAIELSDEILTGGATFNAVDVEVQLPGFIFRDEKEPAGKVIGGRDGEVSLGPDQRALITAENGISVGTLYTVLRRGEDVKNPESGDFVGYKYYFVASIRVDKALEDDVYVGSIRDSRLSVLPDDILVPYLSTRRAVPVSDGYGALTSTEGNVVGFEYAGQSVAGTGSYAFIDKGSGEGVSAGMYIGLYGTPGNVTVDFGDTDLPEDYELVGIMRVIDATDAGAVGYVMRNTSEIRVGDRAGKG